VLTRIRALANAEGVINFSGGFPDPELFPTELLAGITERLPTAHSHVALQCAPSQGIATTIAAVSDHLQELERVRRSHDALTITGSGSGIDAVTLIAKSTLGLTDVVLVETPSYLGAVAGFAAFKATLHSVDTDADRPDVAALAQLLDGGLRAKLLYTIAYYQNPSGHSLCAARWTQAVELCRRHGCADRRERRVSRTRLLPTTMRSAVRARGRSQRISRTDRHVLQDLLPRRPARLRRGAARGHRAVGRSQAEFRPVRRRPWSAVWSRNSFVALLQRAGHWGHARCTGGEARPRCLRCAQACLPASPGPSRPAACSPGCTCRASTPPRWPTPPERTTSPSFPGAAFFAEWVENEYLRLSFS